MTRLLIIAAALLTVVYASSHLPPTCHKKVYCNSELLHHVQMARLYDDSKTFVDLHMLYDEETTLAHFEELMVATDRNPSREDLRKFVDDNFDDDRELEMWTSDDYHPNPTFVNGIRDETLKQFGKDVHDIWPALGRKVRQDVIDQPDQYSLIPVTHGFIIPGGRFREIYYWDTYWIIEGLLISGMKDTARGMIENLIELLKKLGLVPNGSRWYYELRSQPPLLIPMVSLYYRETQDINFLREHIESLEAELYFWLDRQTVSFERNGRAYTMLRYNVPSLGPRPESYYEDYNHGQYFQDEESRQQFYTELKSAAESGWDFSSRWFIDENGGNTGNLTRSRTTHIVPVDLNSMFANALQTVSYFRALLLNQIQSAVWAYHAGQWRNAINEVLWNEEDGIWYDYDVSNSIHRKFFFPTNLSPLWLGAVERPLIESYGPRVLSYLHQSSGLDFPGGVPSTLDETGEQWDFPNAWPPLMGIVVNALEAIDTDESRDLAFHIAQKWVRACLKGFKATDQMFEKYDVVVPGQYGGGGEYTVQEGFGWSNGVVIEFLAKYGLTMTATDDPESEIKSKKPRSEKYPNDA